MQILMTKVVMTEHDLLAHGCHHASKHFLITWSVGLSLEIGHFVVARILEGLARKVALQLGQVPYPAVEARQVGVFRQGRAHAGFLRHQVVLVQHLCCENE